jgi:hypothetical protein
VCECAYWFDVVQSSDLERLVVKRELKSPVLKNAVYFLNPE